MPFVLLRIVVSTDVGGGRVQLGVPLAERSVASLNVSDRAVVVATVGGDDAVVEVGRHGVVVRQRGVVVTSEPGDASWRQVRLRGLHVGLERRVSSLQRRAISQVARNVGLYVGLEGADVVAYRIQLGTSAPVVPGSYLLGDARRSRRSRRGGSGRGRR